MLVIIFNNFFKQFRLSNIFLFAFLVILNHFYNSKKSMKTLFQYATIISEL